MSDPFVDTFEIIDCNGNKHRVFPMKLKDRVEVTKLVSRFSDTMVFFNFMNPLIVDGEVVRDVDGDITYNDIAFKAILRIAEIATGETEKELIEWLDVVTVEELVSMFLNLSQLKKKTVVAP